MLSLERVKAALNFNNPDKVPVFNLIAGDVLPLLLTISKDWKPGWNEGEEGIFPHVRGSYNWDRPQWAKVPEFEGNKWRSIPHEEIDEWGNIWNMKGNDENMGHPGRAVLHDWKNYDDHINSYTPEADAASRYQFGLNLKKKMNKDHYLMLIPPTFGPSQTVSTLRGFNTYLIDHRRYPENLKKALDLVAEYHVDLIKCSFKYGLNPHGIFIIDDLGEQKGPFFGPKMFRKHYESSYRRIIDGAHALGVDVHLHCCGKIDPLVPILIDWGIDSIELDSPRMSGYPDLRPYRGKVMFWGCVNIQSIYTQGTPEETEREVWHMVKNLGTENGGFGAYFYPQPRDIRAPMKNIKAFQRGLDKYSIYSKIPKHWWDYPVISEWKDNEVPNLPPLDL